MKKIIALLTLLTSLTFAANSTAAVHPHSHHMVTQKTAQQLSLDSLRLNPDPAVFQTDCGCDTVTAMTTSQNSAAPCYAASCSVSYSGFMTAPAMDQSALPTPIFASPYMIDNLIELSELPNATWMGYGMASKEPTPNDYYHDYHSKTTTVNGYTTPVANLSHGNTKGVDETAGYGISPRAGSLPEEFGYGMPSR